MPAYNDWPLTLGMEKLAELVVDKPLADHHRAILAVYEAGRAAGSRRAGEATADALVWDDRGLHLEHEPPVCPPEMEGQVAGWKAHMEAQAAAYAAAHLAAFGDGVHVSGSRYIGVDGALNRKHDEARRAAFKRVSRLRWARHAEAVAKAAVYSRHLNMDHYAHVAHVDAWRALQDDGDGLVVLEYVTLTLPVWVTPGLREAVEAADGHLRGEQRGHVSWTTQGVAVVCCGYAINLVHDPSDHPAFDLATGRRIEPGRYLATPENVEWAVRELKARAYHDEAPPF